MPQAASTHAVLIEPRRVFAVQRSQGRSTFREEPLAYLRLPGGVELSGLGWQVMARDGEEYLLGEDAVQVSDHVDEQTEAVFPLTDLELGQAPPEAWAALTTLVSELVGAETPGRVVALTPSLASNASNLWLHALPETLIGDVQPDYSIVSSVRLLADRVVDPDGDERPNGERGATIWSWLVGEVGVSIGARVGEQFREAFVPRDDSPQLGDPELDRAALVERAMAASIGLFRDEWSARRAGIRLAVTATIDCPRALESAVCRAVSKYELGPELRAETVDLAHLLDAAIEQFPSGPVLG